LKKALSIFFLLLNLLAFKNIAYAQQEIYKCIVFSNAGDYKKAIEFGKLAVKKYPTSSVAYLCLGHAYSNLGELKLAYENMKKAESLANNEKDLMEIYNQIGMILNEMGYSDDALLYYNRSLSLAKSLGNTNMQANLLNNIAMIYKDKGNLDKALSYYKESLSLTINKKDKATTYSNIANIYDEEGDYQKAVEYFQKAIEIYEKYGDYHEVSLVKLNLGDTYRKMKDYENAEKYLSEGLQGVIKVGDKYGEATGCRYAGWLLQDKGYEKKAKEYYNCAYKLFKSIGAERDAQSVLNEMKKLDKSK
jgi:tetratricopeptide (TPR) repeat protein